MPLTRHQKSACPPPHHMAGAEQIEDGNPSRVKARGEAGVCFILEMNKEEYLRVNREYGLKETACELEETITLL